MMALLDRAAEVLLPRTKQNLASNCMISLAENPNQSYDYADVVVISHRLGVLKMPSRAG
jgi:hypothetical protein